MEWRRKEVQDHTPKKGLKTFIDLVWGDYEICDYVDCYYVFHKKKYVTRVRTLRMAKQIVRWMEGEKAPYVKKGTTWTLHVPLWSVRKNGWLT